MGFALLEDKIVTGLAFASKSREQEISLGSVNSHPHMTFHTAQWTAVDSNFVL